ncbi:MAG: aminopeptidase P family protein [Thermoleophilia bacterium]|nr:aminopeptidase P family protein [Thermoleophilia bacterium]
MAAKSVFDSLLVSHLPNVRYLTGFTGSSGCALITRRRKAFFTDSRYRLQAARQVKEFEIVIAAGPPLLAACAYIRAKRLRPGVLGYEGARVSCRELAAVRRALKGVRLRDASGFVEEQRLCKDRKEQSRLRRAARLADLAFERLYRSRVVGRTEREVAWMLEAAMREEGSEPVPFEIIVASGPRSAMPHGVAGKRIIRSSELLVVDLGASVDGYCCDMTRTFTTGKLAKKQLQIYETVRTAQEMAVNAIKPGAACSELDRLARDHITAAGYGEAFLHSLGHGVGLEAHEQPVLSIRSREILKAGMTVTVEPGIYLARTGGVRIEDTVLVGKNGPVLLTRYPRELRRLR